MLDATGLREDANLLQSTLEALHPGLYRYNTPAQIRASFDWLRREFAHNRTLPQAFLAISAVTASVQCGHTFPNPTNQSGDVQSRLFRRGTLPFTFRWIGADMVVARSAGGQPRLAPGTIIQSINGVPSRTILRKLLPYARADGANNQKRWNLLEVRGTEKFETFDIYYPLVFPPRAGGFVLKVCAPGDEKPRDVVLPPEPRVPPEATGTQDGPLWTIHMVRSDVAKLTMPTWVAYNTPWDWKGDLQRTFERLSAERIPNLIIDIRGNEGGSSVGDVILSYLVDRETPLPMYERFTTYRKVPAALNAYLDTWDNSFRDWGEEAQPASGRFFRMTKYDDAGGNHILPAAPRYLGRVYVLVDAANSSATFEFASAVKTLHVGTLVGQDTGGNQRGINGGAFFFLRLPHSGIEVDVPLIAQFPAGGVEAMPDAGLEPDVAVIPSTADMAEGVDTEVRAVFGLIDARPMDR